MKNCNTCGVKAPDEALSCTNCGADLRFSALINNRPLSVESYQHTSGNDTFLKVLCALTIAGAVYNIIYIIYNYFNLAGVFDGVDITSIILPIGFASTKLVGAILMLFKKKAGLYLYTLAAGILIILSIWELINVIISGDGLMSNGTTALFSILTQGIFVVMYWLKGNTRHLS